jgi:hypothetical protein
MARRYDAFLIRRWSLDDGRWRIEVTHVQSGAKTLVASLVEVTEWIASQSVEACDEPSPPSPR